MSSSNFYFQDWCRKQLEHLELDVQNGNVTWDNHEDCVNEVEQYLHNSINNDVTYSSESLDIIRQHNVTSWDWLEKNYDCKCYSFSDVAYWTIFDLCMEDNTFHRFADYLVDKFGQEKLHPLEDPQEEM